MNPKQKKTYIALALFASCVLMLVLLFNSKSVEDLSISDLAVVDSLIYHELETYSIKKKQIKPKTIKTGNFSRIYYDVRMPRGISKTQVHADLHYRLHELEIATPARLVLPEKELAIHVYYNNTIIRTVQLRTDTSLKVQTFNSTLAFYTQKSPDLSLVERIRDLGEFTPLVFRTLEPKDAEKWYGKVSQALKPIYIWVNEADRDDVIASTVWLKDKLPQFNSIARGITVWVDQTSASKQDAQVSYYRNNKIKALKLDHAVYFDAEDGIYAYEQALRKFKQLSQMDYAPILMVNVNSKSVSVIESRIVELKKLGIRFEPPVFRDF